MKANSMFSNPEPNTEMGGNPMQVQITFQI